MGLEKYYADIFFKNDLAVDLPRIAEQHFSIDLYKIYETPIYQHRYLEILYVIDGIISVNSCYRDFTLTAGDIIIINPITTHSVRSVSAKNIVLIVTIDTDFYNLTDHLYIDSASYYKCNSSNNILNLKQMLNELYNNLQNESFESVINLKISELIYILKNNYSIYQYNIKHDKHSIISANESQTERIWKLFEYIRLNYTKNFTLVDVACKLSINKFYLSHIINDVLGISFSELVNNIRTHRALILILGTKLPLNEISQMTGFINYNSFVRNLKIRTSHTPTEYRNMNKNRVPALHSFNWRKIYPKSESTDYIENGDLFIEAAVEKTNDKTLFKILSDEEHNLTTIIIGNYGSAQNMVYLQFTHLLLKGNSNVCVNKYLLPPKYFNKEDFLFENDLNFKGKIKKINKKKIHSDIGISVDIFELPLKISLLVDSYTTIMISVQGECSTQIEA